MYAFRGRRTRTRSDLDEILLGAFEKWSEQVLQIVKERGIACMRIVFVRRIARLRSNAKCFDIWRVLNREIRDVIDYSTETVLMLQLNDTWRSQERSIQNVAIAVDERLRSGKREATRLEERREKRESGLKVFGFAVSRHVITQSL